MPAGAIDVHPASPHSPVSPFGPAPVRAYHVRECAIMRIRTYYDY